MFLFSLGIRLYRQSLNGFNVVCSSRNCIQLSPCGLLLCFVQKNMFSYEIEIHFNFDFSFVYDCQGFQFLNL